MRKSKDLRETVGEVANRGDKENLKREGVKGEGIWTKRERVGEEGMDLQSEERKNK